MLNLVPFLTDPFSTTPFRPLLGLAWGEFCEQGLEVVEQGVEVVGAGCAFGGEVVFCVGEGVHGFLQHGGLEQLR